jgi:hypothetical protein
VFYNNVSVYLYRYSVGLQAYQTKLFGRTVESADRPHFRVSKAQECYPTFEDSQDVVNTIPRHEMVRLVGLHAGWALPR